MKLSKDEKERVFELLNWRLDGVNAWVIAHDPKLKQLFHAFLKFRMDLRGF